jgi:hypothetical protein
MGPALLNRDAGQPIGARKDSPSVQECPFTGGGGGPKLLTLHNVEWKRKHETREQARIAPTVHYPTSLEDLITICSAPERGNMTVAGSHWALSAAAIADAEFIETNDPNGVQPAMAKTLVDVIPGCLNPAVLDQLAHTSPPTVYPVHVEAGKRVYQLYSELDLNAHGALADAIKAHVGASDVEKAYRQPMALPTMGSAGMQTIVGALTTGTHGNNLQLAGVADAVLAIHLVADGGDHYWIERHDRGVFFGVALVDDAELRERYERAGGEGEGAPQFHIVREDDNDLFEAVLISAGRFGVIYSVVLAAVPQFSLRQRVWVPTWQEVKKDIETARNGVDPGEAWPFLFAHAEDPTKRTDYLQAVVCLTPTHSDENLCGVTKRWTINPITGGRAERRGDPDGSIDPRTSCLIFPKAGNQHPYASNATFLENACMSASFIAGLLEELEAALVDFVESHGEVIPPLLAAVASAGGAGLVQMIPFFALLIEVIRRLIDALDAEDTLADALNDVRTAIMGVSEHTGLPAPTFVWRLLVNLLFRKLQTDGEQIEGISYAILENHDYLDQSCNVDVDSLEVFFDGEGERLIPYIDALIAKEIELESHGRAFCGYASLRFMTSSRALIAPQRWPLSCSVEVAGLHGVEGTHELMNYAAQLAKDFNLGGMLHWGQRNDYTALELNRYFRYVLQSNGIERWRTQLARITDSGRLNHFSNAQTRQWGLEVGA